MDFIPPGFDEGLHGMSECGCSRPPGACPVTPGAPHESSSFSPHGVAISCLSLRNGMAVGRFRLYGPAMAYECRRSHFTVTVRSGFISRSQWAVHAVVDYLPDGPVGNWSDVESEARLELMLGIARESRRGGDDGTGNVVVLVEGDTEVAGLFRGGDQCIQAMQLV